MRACLGRNLMIRVDLIRMFDRTRRRVGHLQRTYYETSFEGTSAAWNIINDKL